MTPQVRPVVRVWAVRNGETHIVCTIVELESQSARRNAANLAGWWQRRGWAIRQEAISVQLAEVAT